MDEKQSIKILLIEDNPGDVWLIKEMAKETPDARLEFEHADRLSSGLERLAKNAFDVILLDLGLPDSDGSHTLSKILSTELKVPVVALTGSIADEMVGVKAIQEGAQDYLTKSQLHIDSLIRSIRYAIERKRIEKEMRLLNESLEQRAAERTAELIKANEALHRKITECKCIEDKLRNLNESLELRVKERTTALTNANEELREEIIERKRIEEVLCKTENKLCLVIDSISDCLWSAEIDRKGRFTYHYYSPAVERITGRPPKFYVQGLERWSSTIHPGDIAQVEKAFARIINGQSHHEEEEYRIMRSDGIVRWVRDSVVAKCDKHGILHLHGIVSDITERKLTEQKLKKYEILFSEINDLAYILDIQGNFLFVNKIFEKLTGHKPEEFMGKSFLPLFDEENQKKALDIYVRTLKGEHPQYKLRFKDTGILCEYKNIPIQDEKGNIVSIIGTARDITEQNRIEEVLRKSEAGLANAQRITHIGNYEWDIIKNRAYWSLENYRIFGVDQKQPMVTYDMFLERIHPDDRELVRKSLHEAICEGRPYHINYRIILPHGIERIIHSEGEVTCDDSGKPVQISGTNQDVTELKRAEKELKKLTDTLEQRVAERTAELVKANNKLWKSERKYRVLVENLPQRIFYKDTNLMYVSCNENYAGDLHITPDEIPGKTDYDFYPEELAEKYRADDKRIIASRQTEEIEEKYLRNGQELTIHTVKTPIKDENGNVIGVLGIFWDITEKVSLEKEAILNRQLAALGKIAASVGHEINNPLTGIINYAQILFNNSVEKSKEKDIASRIIKEGNRIANIIKILLSFVRPCERKEEKGIVGIPEILSETITLAGSQLKKEGIKVKLAIPATLPGIIAHPEQIQQVFLNVISNALYALNQKYPETHDDKILEISGEEITIDGHSYVKITFYDHGIGIPAHIKDKVIDPFFTTKPRGKGTGLGLSISHSIIKDHGGKIVINSTEGEYTRIAFILPAENLMKRDRH